MACEAQSPSAPVVQKLHPTLAITPSTGIAGTKFVIKCTGFEKNGSTTVKIAQSSGTLVIDKKYDYVNPDTLDLVISTYGFNPGRYKCHVEDTTNGQAADAEFDVTGKKYIIFEDDFSNGFSGWPTYTSENYTTLYDKTNQGPAYYFRIRDNKLAVLYRFQTRVGKIKDCIAEVDCWSKPEESTFAGILFRAVLDNNEDKWDKTSQYVFLADSGYGAYCIHILINGKWKYPVFQKVSDVVKKDGSPNRLKVACVGSTIETYINGVQVETLTDETIKDEGYVGLFIETIREPNALVYFDNFLVYQIK